MNGRVVRASRSRRYAISIFAVMLIGACWVGSAAPAHAEAPFLMSEWGNNLRGQGVGATFASTADPRIIGVNEPFLESAPPKKGGNLLKLLEGEAVVKSLRVETSFNAEEASKLVLNGKKFEHMTCIVGNGQGEHVLVPWRVGLTPTLQRAMEQIGKGNPEQGQIKWEEGALAEVKQCAKSPQVAVIEILNEPWALRNSPTGMSGAEYVANGELYGRMLKGLLERVNASGLEGKVTLLASGLVAEKGQRHVAPEAWKQLWLEPLVRGGGEELQKYIGGLDFHPYGKAKGNKIPVQLEGMQVQYQYITENNPAAHLPWAHPELYVTEYNYYKAIKDNESPGAEAKEKVETQKMFHRLKTEVPGVKGIWFFNYIDAGCKHWGWYAEPCLKGNPVKSQEPIEWAKVRPVRGVVEACAKEEKKREEGVLNPEESEC